MSHLHLREIEFSLNETLGESFDSQKAHAIQGGDINHCYRVTIANEPLFLKTNTATCYPLFRTEQYALLQIIGCSTLLCPKPIICDQTTNSSFLLMQHIDLKWDATKEFYLGEQLAKMHKVVSNSYGWQEDNFIGLTTQLNSHQCQWHSFWIENRIKPQRELARANRCPGHTLKLIELAEEHSQAILQNHQPAPSFLHGDLWQGNVSFSKNGEAIIFDPASYFGDRETDIAMTELFGGFSENFYAGYNKEWALNKGYQTRRAIYQLYHVINHFNLFGSPYDNQAASLCKHILMTTL